MSMSNSIFIPELLSGIDESLLAECDEIVVANMRAFTHSGRIKLRRAFIIAAILTVVALSSLLFVLFRENIIGFIDLPFFTKKEEVTNSYGTFIIEDGVLVSYEGDATEIVIPNGVIKISAAAFSKDLAIRTLTLGPSVEEIDKGVFDILQDLNEIRTAEGGAISSSDGLVISANGKQIIFINKDSLAEHLAIPEGVLLIEKEMFKNNDRIKSVKFPSTLYKISYSAFAYCKSLSEVSFGGTIIIEENAFAGCEMLAKIDFGKVEEIGKKAFFDCSSLIDISFENVKEIGISAFENAGLRCVDLGRKVERINSKAFQNTALEDIYIPLSIMYTSSDVFTNCNLKIIYFRGNEAQWKSMKNIWSKVLVSLVDYKVVFLNESTLITGTVELTFTSNKDGTCIASPLDKKNAVGKATIPQKSPAGDTVVGIESFNYCSSISEIILPDTVTEIPERAFYGCYSLQSIKMPGVTSIGNYAFASCTSLSSIRLNSKISIIPSGCFSGCSSLTLITIPMGVRIIESQAFAGCPIKEIVMPSTLRILESNVFGHGTHNDPCYLERIDLSKTSIVELPSDAFAGEKKLTEVLLPISLGTIGKGAFEECISLTSIELPKWLNTIDEYAFAYCHNLKDIILPSGLIWLGDFAFTECSSLEEIVIPSKVKAINIGTFGGCTALKNVIISEGIPYIGQEAFKKCTNLITVSIPDSVTYIDKSAFSGCTSLQTSIPQRNEIPETSIERF